MNDEIVTQLQFFLISILWGGMILLAYDGLRIFRRLIKQGSIVLAIEDLIFWVIASLFIFAMIYEENDGIIRGFAVMGMAIGMIIYHYIISEFLVNRITKFIRILMSPIIRVFQELKRLISFLLAKGRKATKFIIKQLKKLIKSVTIILNAKKMKSVAKRNSKADNKASRKSRKDKKRQVRQKSKKLGFIWEMCAMRRRYKKRTGIGIIAFVVLMLAAIVSYSRIGLNERYHKAEIKMDRLQAQIDEEKEREEDIKNLKVYVQTKSYIEEIARDKLGLVYKDDVIFTPEEKN